MKIMVVGGGGREHAIIKKIKENPAVSEIFALPGNGGIAADEMCIRDREKTDTACPLRLLRIKSWNTKMTGSLVREKWWNLHRTGSISLYLPEKS